MTQPPLTSPPQVTERWALRTETGSEYIVSKDETGQWWLEGSNVPSRISKPIPEGLAWRIDQPAPWPNVVGTSVRLAAPTTMALDDPARIPGGGKRTSYVVDRARLR